MFSGRYIGRLLASDAYYKCRPWAAVRTEFKHEFSSALSSFAVLCLRQRTLSGIGCIAQLPWQTSVMLWRLHRFSCSSLDE